MVFLDKKLFLNIINYNEPSINENLLFAFKKDINTVVFYWNPNMLIGK